ncbi:MAG: hypothetical protein QM703_23800 [Gemmatales bacterium]
MTQYPISKVCPQCGWKQFRRKKPEEIIAFTSDRLCSKCETRYTPPTPRWAGLVFVVSGLLLALFFGFLLTVCVVLFSAATFPITVLVGFGFVVGVCAFCHGIKALMK